MMVKSATTGDVVVSKDNIYDGGCTIYHLHLDKVHDGSGRVQSDISDRNQNSNRHHVTYKESLPNPVGRPKGGPPLSAILM